MTSKKPEFDNSPKTLMQLYATHTGKASDKWSSYLETYERVLSDYRDKPISILEIGIQNGGSLEIWADYFPKARAIVGCDMDRACDQLEYDDPRIKLVIGDANTDKTESAILANAKGFDIILDDGSHQSVDIIRSFARYIPHLTNDGVYIVEDLHCSYRQKFGGGLYHPYSAQTFFKRLVDVINHEHWGIDKSCTDVLNGILCEYDINISSKTLKTIHSVEFLNSLCIVRKNKPEHNRLNRRIIAGSVAAIYPRLLDLHSTPLKGSDETRNEWTARSTPPEEELLLRIKELAMRDQRIQKLAKLLNERDGKITGLSETVAERDGQIEGLSAELEAARGVVAERDERIESLSTELEAKRGVIAEHKERIASLNETVAERDGWIEGLSAEFEATRVAMDERDEYIADLDSQLAAVYASRSWQVTAPLRAIRVCVRRIGNRILVVRALMRITLTKGPRASYRLFKERSLLLSSGTFNVDYYLRQYPDVAAARIDPVLHYLLYGASEGRDPNAHFDTDWYLEQNLDVADAGANPLVHYHIHGAVEGRAQNPTSPASDNSLRLGWLNDIPSATGAPESTAMHAPGLLQHTPIIRQQTVSKRKTAIAYWALRQEVMDSGLWDEKWYLSRYYENYIASKKRRMHSEPFFPLDYYLLEGWSLGHEPSNLLPIQIDQQKAGCSKIEYFLNHLRFAGYQFDENIWVPTEKQIREYLEQKQGRASKKVIYTCIVNNYDELIQPYFIMDDWDYVCFTDDPRLVGLENVGVWEIRPLSHTLTCSVRTNRWHKIHPHLLFPDYAESIYVDGNINILSNYIFDQIIKRDATILLPQHFIRNCIYEEIDALLHRTLTSNHDKALLLSHRQFLEQEGFPKAYGLSENNLIYRRHHDDCIIKLMHEWWIIYERYSSRDQVSLAYVFWKHNISLHEYMFANCRVNYRDFWVMKHNPDTSDLHLKKARLTAPTAVLQKIAPAFARNNVAIVFSTNKQFIPYLGVAIFSLIENASDESNYDIVILAKSIPRPAFAKIFGLAHGRSNVSIRVYDTTALVEALPKDIFHVDGYVPVETYNKCFITEILSPEYRRCVYLDSDILILHDIQELHDIDLHGHAIGASVNVANVNAAFCKKVIKGRRFDDYLTNDLGISDHNKYFQAGVIVMDMRKLREINLPSRSIIALKRVENPIFFDQCVVNSIFYGDVFFFSTSWNHVWYMQQYSHLRGSVADDVFFDYARGRIDPKIVHYASRDKPQNKLGWALSDLFWEYAYASPFIDDIREDILDQDTEVARIIASMPSTDWYNIKPRVLVHIHLYYLNQLDIMLNSIRNVSACEYDLFVTMVERDENIEQRILNEWKDAQIVVLPNVGYDVYPFLHILNNVMLSDYHFVLKIHTKNARQPCQDMVYGINVPGYKWRDELLNAIIGSREIFEENLTRFLEDKELGCIGAAKFIFSTDENYEERNYELKEWRRKCGIERGNHYVGGSMFFARAYPFERLKGLNTQPKDFETPHMGTKDHKNTAHIFERLFGIVIENEGFVIRGGAA